jgi:hypothetical protein
MRPVSHHTPRSGSPLCNLFNESLYVGTRRSAIVAVSLCAMCLLFAAARTKVAHRGHVPREARRLVEQRPVEIPRYRLERVHVAVLNVDYAPPHGTGGASQQPAPQDRLFAAIGANHFAIQGTGDFVQKRLADRKWLQSNAGWIEQCQCARQRSQDRTDVHGPAECSAASRR